MATFDDLQALNAMYAQALSPINRLGAGQVALAQNELAQRQQMEEEARRNLFTEQLVARNQQFQVGQADAQRRAQIGLQTNSQQFQTERDKLNFSQATTEANRLFQHRQTGLDMDVARVLKGELEELGGAVPPDANSAQIRNEIQKRLGERLALVMKQIAPIGKEIMDEGSHDPAKMEKQIQFEIASDPDFQSIVKDMPEILAGLESGGLKLKDVPAELQKDPPYWSRSNLSMGLFDYDSDLDKKKRVNAYLAALLKAQTKIADRELQIGLDFRKSPQYLEKLGKYKALNAEAQAVIGRLQNPDRIKEAMNFMNATPATNATTRATGGRNFGLPPHVPARGVGASVQW